MTQRIGSIVTMGTILVAGAGCAYDEAFEDDHLVAFPSQLHEEVDPPLLLTLDEKLENALLTVSRRPAGGAPTAWRPCVATRAMGPSYYHPAPGFRYVFRHPDGQRSVVRMICADDPREIQQPR